MKYPITDYMETCIICGAFTTDHHHLLYGTSHRKLADEDGLIIPLCKEHHLGNKSFHRQRELQVLSNVLGQLAYEKRKCAEGMSEDDARADFRRRYGKNYL